MQAQQKLNSFQSEERRKKVLQNADFSQVSREVRESKE